MKSAGLITQLIDQRFGLLEIGAIEALREPVVDRSEHRPRPVTAALGHKQPSEANRRTQFPRLGVLLARNLDRSLKATLRV